MNHDAPDYGLWGLAITNAAIFIMVGFLPQWPTLLTLAMFPVLVMMYVLLAHREEREVIVELRTAWDVDATAPLRWRRWLSGTATASTRRAEGRY